MSEVPTGDAIDTINRIVYGNSLSEICAGPKSTTTNSFKYIFPPQVSSSKFDSKYVCSIYKIFFRVYQRLPHIGCLTVVNPCRLDCSDF